VPSTVDILYDTRSPKDVHWDRLYNELFVLFFMLFLWGRSSSLVPVRLSYTMPWLPRFLNFA